MKAAIVFLCLSVSAFAQQNDLSQPRSPQGRLASACGPAKASFKVDLDSAEHGPMPPEAGKAMVYFIHDTGIGYGGSTIGYPTTKYGVDGSWVGAGHGDSWFAVAVAPGEHHVCTTLQSSFVDQRVELAHFTAEAGKTYFFRTRLVMSRSVELLELERIDSDQGGYLISSFPLAKAHARR
ncbi:MAG: hypothetical protein ACLQG3_12380 [Terracidiphilus sp.]